MSLILLVAVLYTKKEKFTMYTLKPFNYKHIGTSPLNYYNKPLYRTPYRYPFKFKTTYPTNYMTYYN